MPVRDHPRMRGEKICHSDGEAVNMGSPPHARGKAYAMDIP